MLSSNIASIRAPIHPKLSPMLLSTASITLFLISSVTVWTFTPLAISSSIQPWTGVFPPSSSSSSSTSPASSSGIGTSAAI